MKKLGLILGLILAAFSMNAQSDILIIDYANSFSSDQTNNNSIIYNRLLATQTSVVRVAAIPGAINVATYDQVWIFGNPGVPTPATLTPIVNYMNAGGAVYIQSEVSCCNNQAAFVDQLIDLTVTAGGAITHNQTMGGFYQTGPSATPCSPTPPNWVTHGAAARPFQGTPAVNVYFEANNVCGGAIGPGDIIGVKFRACDMISGQGALMSIGDFNVFPTAGTCGAVGILGTANDNTVIDHIAATLPTLTSCAPVTNTTMNATNDTTLCPGDQWPGATFTSNPAGATFDWINSNTAIGLGANGNGNMAAFTTTNNTGAPITGQIIVTPMLNGCPGIPDTFNITVNPNPIADAGLDTTGCVGDPLGMGGNPTATGGSGGPYSYNWTPATTLNNSNSSNPNSTPAAVGSVTYTVEVTDALGCVGYDSLVVTGIACCPVQINDTIIADALCLNSCDGSVQIVAAGATQYSIDGINWQPGNTFNGLCAGNYMVYAGDGSCSDSLMITITEPTAITLPAVVTDASCYGMADGQIIVAPQGGTPGYNYSWSPTNVGNTPVAAGITAGQHTVTVTDANGCTADSTYTVNQPPPLNFVTFTSDIQAGCSPLEVTFTNTTDPNIVVSQLWTLGNGQTDTNGTVTTTYTDPGSYDVTLLVTDTFGCQGLLTQVGYITVYPDPIADFAATPGNVTVFNPTYNFVDLSQWNIVSWDWNFDNMGSSTNQNPSFTFPEDTGSYNISLLVIDNNGCRDSITQTVRVKGEYGIYVPNAFTPDQDGLNEGFIPTGFGISEIGYNFSIFNRWGEKIFETNDITRPWFGEYKNKLVQSGVYVWQVIFYDLNGHEHTRTGKVTIIK